MSSPTTTPSAGGFGLWERQVAAILAIEIRKNFLSPRAFLLYALTGFPILILALDGWFEPTPLQHIWTMYGVFYQFLIRFVVFFGSVWIFTNLFRGEILERSLHYYFLIPVRREVLVAGKFLTGVFGSAILFGTTTLLALVACFSGHGLDVLWAQIFTGAGLKTLVSYLGTTALACVGYGAVFLLLSLFVKNPIIPAVLIWAWEGINIFLPPLLKKLSIVYYLQSLAPLPILDESTFAIIADPVSPPVAVIGLILLSLVLLGLAALRMRHMEIAYGAE